MDDNTPEQLDNYVLEGAMSHSFTFSQEKHTVYEEKGGELVSQYNPLYPQYLTSWEGKSATRTSPLIVRSCQFRCLAMLPPSYEVIKPSAIIGATISTCIFNTYSLIYIYLVYLIIYY